MRRVLILFVVSVLLSGCMTIEPRAPKVAVGTGPVVYLTHVDRIPREAIGKGVIVDGNAVKPAVVGAAVELVGGVVTTLTPAIVDAYKDVERNSATRSVEVYISGYSELAGTDIDSIVKTFSAIVSAPFPTK